MMDLELLVLFLATVFGAVTTSGLGWLDSTDTAGNPVPFNARKFAPGIIRGIVAAIIVFIPASTGYLGMSISVPVVLGAFIAGMSFDVAGNRLAGILGIGQGKTTT